MATRRFASVCCFAWKAAWPCRLFQSDSHKKCCRYLWHCWPFFGFCARASGSAACASGAATLAEIAAAIALCMLAGRPALPRFSSIVCAAAMLTGGPSSRSFKQPRIIFSCVAATVLLSDVSFNACKNDSISSKRFVAMLLVATEGKPLLFQPSKAKPLQFSVQNAAGFCLCCGLYIYRYHVSPKQPRV